MPVNLNQVASQLHYGNNLLDVMGSQFGVPSCAMNFAKEVLNALPSPFLTALNDSLADGRKKAQEVMAQVTRKLFLDSGIVEFDARTGRLRFTNNVSDAEAGKSLLDEINNLGALGEAIGFASEALFIANAIQDQIQDIKNCINQLKNMKGFKSGIRGRHSASGNRIFAMNRHRIESASIFINSCDRVIVSIGEVLEDRFNGTAAEPLINGAFVFPSGDFAGMAASDVFVGAGFAFATPDESTTDESPFYITTTLKPPRSKSGEFILHEKGIYYNSIYGGVDVPENLPDLVALSLLNHEMDWITRTNPNIGGKGQTLTIDDFSKFANTILDINSEAFIDDSNQMAEFYAADSFLQNIENQRNKNVEYASTHVQNLIVSGNAVDSAIVVNEKNHLRSIVSNYHNKIKRRKKQIQVAAIFGRVRNPTGILVTYTPGTIPVNDFSFLNDSPVPIDVSLQKNLMFKSGEVSGVVLPIVNKFSSEVKNNKNIIIDNLIVPNIGVGDIVLSSVSSNLSVQSITDNITTNGLFAIYNFLDTELVAPDSNEYLVTNSIGLDARANAGQLVATSIASVFPSGLGIPYFSGVCKYFKESSSKAASYTGEGQKYFAPSRPASYVKLPDSEDFQSLLYKDAGFTIDFWCHVPTIASGAFWGYGTNTSALHRLVLANENTGGEYTATDINKVYYTKSSDSVFGAIMGFSIDRRLTLDSLPSNAPADNPVNANTMVFHLSPVMSVNTSSVTFINNGKTAEQCALGTGSNSYNTVGLVVNTSSTTNSGYKLNNVSGSFQHIVITGDPTASGNTGAVSMYLNGELLIQRDYTTVFGAKGSPQIPSQIKDNSWKYSTVYASSMSQYPQSFLASSVGWSDFWSWEGPQNSIFTPWIIGGGYTDGLMTKQYGVAETSSEGMNFMGQYGGVRSGLNGYIGSIKFYRVPLSIVEVLKNYNAQKGFFTNIRV